MTIRNLGSTPGATRTTGPVAPQPSQKATPSKGMPAAPAAPSLERRPVRQDSVQISDAARQLEASGTAEAAGTERRQPLTPARVDELRKKVLEGAYNQLSVVDQVARRIQASGDL